MFFELQICSISVLIHSMRPVEQKQLRMWWKRHTYIWWLQGSWPITAMKDKKMAKDCPQPMRLQYPF